MVKKIPTELQTFIDKFFHLNICGIDVITPYHMNSRGSFLKRPVFSGKATAEEIEKMANEIFHKEDFRELNAENIRREMIQSHLGIDCSGFTYQIYNFWIKNISHKGELRDYLPEVNKVNFRKFISRKFKPQSSVSADMFASEPIASRIDLKDIQPGDLIRTRGGKHVLFVVEVEYENALPTKIKVVHSTNKYKRTGVRYEDIFLGKELDLAAANWENHDGDEPSNETYKGYRVLMENNGVFRPNLPLETNK